MKHLWQRLINKIARKLKLYGTLDSEKAIRVLKRENLALKQELAQQQPYAWIDPTIRQRGYEQSAWNAEPERHTDPRQVQGARQRAAMHEVYPKNGDLVQHVNATERKQFTTRKLGPETAILQSMPHKYTLMQHSEPPPGATPYETPAFLTDRKIG